MVVRKRLKLPALPKGKADVVAHVRARHLQLRDASIEKESNTTDDALEADAVEEGAQTGEEEADKKPPKATVTNGRLQEDVVEERE